MNRLTKDLNTPHDDTTYANIVIDAVDRENIVLTKLKHYEDIEEELGIDLILSVNICKKANSQKYVYIRDSYGVDKLTFLGDLDVELFRHRLYANSWGVWVSLDLKDYGKEWSLTREELEDD